MNTFTFHPEETTLELDKIQLNSINEKIIQQLLKEYTHVAILNKHKLTVDNKLLLYGHTGCGKTTTAKAIAKKLNKKIVILNLSALVSSKLGETAKNISEVFKKAIKERAVLFLDEFDYIGNARNYDNKDSHEMKRLVNTIIQLIDFLPNNILLIAATNYSSTIDSALLRRFQLKLKFEAPNKSDLDKYYQQLLQEFPDEFRNIKRVYDISYAETKDIVHRDVKNKIIEKEELKITLENG
ncbi:ATP-binding protein [uncultured Tenacibaculum sp.]|uniref:AAA family ATPase n=1 Tax=uncultured Tenacibaculum sp. TaxID=174713 RepID=UPI002607996A|nr:ATP-binding protein [uncultured Tenacibaculum sp.]